jgi:hypothetical protein
MEDSREVSRKINKFYSYEKETWSDFEDLGSGIFVYHNVVPKNSIDILESVLYSENNNFNYEEAMVGFSMKLPDYRDCIDFKYKRSDIEEDNSESARILKKLWQNLYDKKLPAVKHYCRNFHINELKYWEAMNFIKYGPGQHFKEHHDHGYSYNCVVSLVAYPNDDYEGGELYFRIQDLKIKPRAGDLFIFPSNYMYPHQAMPVISGVKHSIVTMLDYSEKYHLPEFREEEWHDR